MSKLIKKLFNRPTTEYVSPSRFARATRNLHNRCVEDISHTLNGSHPKSKLKVVLVSIERGGSLPTTMLNYSLSKAFAEDIKEGLLTIHGVHCTLSTRDKKPGNNKKALHQLKEDINALLSPSKNSRKELEPRIYIVDDLLDSGTTFKLVQEALHNSPWHFGVVYLFSFAKEKLENAYQKYSLKGFFQETSQIVVGEVIPTKKWLRFWHESAI